MQTLALVGPGTADLLAPTAAALDGRVATVRLDASPDGDADATPDGGADATYRVDSDGAWSAAGTATSLDELLETLAPAYDHALVAGGCRLRLPTVVVGDASVPGDVVRRVEDAAELDPAALAETLADVEPYVTLEELVREAKASPDADRSGAIATFTGRVRARDDPDDDRTESLTFEKYEGVAADRMARIERELEGREGVFDVRMHHRVGTVVDGEDIVFVVVLAGHRREAFRTVEDGIDRLKDEVPIFKKELTEAEEFWVHERSERDA